MRIGVPDASFFWEHTDPMVAAAVRSAIQRLAELGAVIVDVEVPRIEQASAHFEKIFHSDVSAVHAERIATAPDRFGADVRERLLSLGGKVTGPEYAGARLWMEGWRRDLAGVFDGLDAIVHATTPCVAPLVADCLSTTTATRRLASLCYPWSMAGVPSLTVPCGLAEHAMPCAMSIITPWWGEATALRIGQAYQDATDWHLREAPISLQ